MLFTFGYVIILAGCIFHAKTSEVPYWPCELSRVFAHSDKVKPTAAVITFVLAVYAYKISGLLQIAAVLGTFGVLAFDDFRFWLLHILSVNLIVIAAVLRSHIKDCLWVVFVSGLISGLPLLARTHAIMYLEQDQAFPVWAKLLAVPRITREIHLTGKSKHPTTLFLYQTVAVAEWVSLGLIAVVFDM